MKPKPKGYWDKNKVLAEAKKYTTRTEFAKNSGSAWNSMIRNGWRVEATAHMPVIHELGKWNKKNVLEEAKKYKFLMDWRNNSSGSYSVAHKNDWLGEATKHMVKSALWHGPSVIHKFLLSHDIKYTAEKRFKTSKLVKNLPFDFFLEDINLVIEYHGEQHKRGWYGNLNNAKEIQSRDLLKKNWCEVAGIEYLAIEAKKEIQITKKIREKLTELGILKLNQTRNLTLEEQKSIESKIIWTKDTILEDAKKYDHRINWYKASPSAVSIARQNGFYEEATQHMMLKTLGAGYWTVEKILNIAKEYSTISDWRSSNPRSFLASRRHHCYEQAIAHMKKLHKDKGYWTKENVAESAKKYLIHKEWVSEEPSAYFFARKNGWLEEVTAHMLKRKSPKT